MIHQRPFWILLFGLALVGSLLCPALADEKQGMPDLSQVDQTCLPTSTANIIVWFGKHGYPKLIMPGEPGDGEKERILHTIHRIMADTDARFDWGTEQDKVTVGIRKYIQDAGYDCDVEYRGLDWVQATNAFKKARGEPIDPEDKPPAPFTEAWLQENDDPNKGFILLLDYCKYNSGNNVFTNAWNAGHAVTLVNAEPDMLLVHDPAHEDDEPGRKILTPTVLKSGYWQEKTYLAPVAGLVLLTGSLLEGPEDGQVMLTGAVCITMHPVKDGKGPDAVPSKTVGSSATLAGSGSNGPAPVPAKPVPATTPAPASAPSSGSSGWSTWFFQFLFGK